MTQILDTQAPESTRCPHCPVAGELDGVLGHDELGHRTVRTLLRFGIETRWQLAQATALDLSYLRGLGPGSLARIREVFPEPSPQPAPIPATALDEAPASAVAEYGGTALTGAERDRVALLTALPAETDVSVDLLADRGAAAALWVLCAISRTDQRVWRRVYRHKIAFRGLLNESHWTDAERMLLRLAVALSSGSSCLVDFSELAAVLDDEQWQCLVTALRVVRTRPQEA